MTPSLPNEIEDRLGANPPTNEELPPEARRRLSSLKVVTLTSKKTLTTIALLRFLDLDPRDYIDEDLNPQIIELLENNYGSLTSQGGGP